MFNFPQGDSKASLQGTSEENPIVLSSDNPDEFRALMWVLNALYVLYSVLLILAYSSQTSMSRPSEIHRVTEETTQGVDMSRLVPSADLVNRYAFGSTEKWAHDIIIRRCSDSVLGGLCFQENRTFRELEYLLEVAVRIDCQALRKLVEGRWIFQLAETFRRSSHADSSSNLRDALNAGQRLGLREFTGGIFYLLMTSSSKMCCNSAYAEGTPAVCLPQLPGILTRNEMHQLLTGFYSLSMMTNVILREDAIFAATTSCEIHLSTKRLSSNRSSCNDIAAALWRRILGSDEIVRSPPGQILWKLDFVLKQVAEADGLCEDCCTQAVDVLMASSTLVKETMADHFLGPLPT